MSNPAIVSSPITQYNFNPLNWGGDVCTQLGNLLATNNSLQTFFSWLLDPTTNLLSDQATLPLQQLLANAFVGTMTGGGLSGGYDAYACTLSYCPNATLPIGFYALKCGLANLDGPSTIQISWTPPTGTAITSSVINIVFQGSQLTPNQMVAGHIYLMVFDGVNMWVLNPESAYAFNQLKTSGLYSITSADPCVPIVWNHGLPKTPSIVEVVGVAQGAIGPLTAGQELDSSAFFFQDGTNDNYGNIVAISRNAGSVVLYYTPIRSNIGWYVKIDGNNTGGGHGDDHSYNYNPSDWMFKIRAAL